MLNGIEVLNEYFIMNEFPVSALILMLIFLVICFIFSLIKFKILHIIIFSVSASLCVLSFIYGIDIKINTPKVKEYQVTIDKSVSMVDFTSKYDIIRVDGEIYTIREKENE